MVNPPDDAGPALVDLDQKIAGAEALRIVTEAAATPAPKAVKTARSDLAGLYLERDDLVGKAPDPDENL